MSTAAETVAHKPTGRSIIACQPVEATQSPLIPQDLKFYAVEPHSGKELPTLFLSATQKEVDDAGWKAWQAFHTMQDRSASDRAALLELIAQRITEMGDDLLAMATDETGLGPARLVSERDRTVNTLRMFAGIVREGSWVDAAIETGQPSRRPIAKPDLRRMLKALGPVAVFGAGNFPLAYSTAGGDTASALAAGCPVIVKGHPGHPGTGELVAQAVASAVDEARFDPGTFSFLHAGGLREMVIGESLVRHAAVRAVGFTGSLSGGMALAKMATERPDPIPVFAEMGSTNPMFVLPAALESQGDAIAERVFSSATNANGQMCTCPGLVFVARGNGSDAFIAALAKLTDAATAQLMLSQRTRGNFGRRIGEVADVAGVELRAGKPPEQAGGDKAAPPQPIKGSPLVFRTNFETFRKTPTLHEEIFGPAVIVVVCESAGQLADAAASIQGSLTGTIWAAGADESHARRLQRILEQRVGRLIFNGVPTGVEVCAAMVHGGPYPATNQSQSTAVGPMAMTRWCRPVCYQNVPEGFLPAELRNANPLKIRRLVNGAWADERAGGNA